MSGSVEDFSSGLSEDVRHSVRAAATKFTRARLVGLQDNVPQLEIARTQAAAIKDFVLANLKDLLLQFEAMAQENGVQVHWANDAKSASDQILQICASKADAGSTIVKAKSMATEEIHLNEVLLGQGFDVVETDLGEFVVQLDEDTPSHIVAPIIHKSARDVSRTFEAHGLGPRSEDPVVLTKQARTFLREKFKTASIGISGVNFGIAETGRIVLVENEGNNRFCTTAPKIHIALMGIEKLLPSERHLPLFLKLLCGSATGQQLATTIHLISGPKRQQELDGPEEVHVILLDNGRSGVLASEYREILRCIRCGACLNVCPVYRQASGHGYGSVYSGPVGAVLTPLLSGLAPFGHLAKASTLCGACEEVCPVKIPIPDMLLNLRHDSAEASLPMDPGSWKAFSFSARNPVAWRAGLEMLPLLEDIPLGPANSWAKSRELPHREGRSFRRWWRDRS